MNALPAPLHSLPSQHPSLPMEGTFSTKPLEFETLGGPWP